ncbi:hypothetical protein GGI15_004415 [Coemansia interrupta]|uniref:MFS general substrate transporter n=1 Tax=Coemansia interrupta TaxID=1126814 RepID=A0A9W8H942_9FUNG|nr:hypothetical protein GGI15_004415 [Coemansia interrupta]
MARLRYHGPLAQVLIISFVCFLCPGMFNALNAMGGAGQVDRTVSNNTNTGIYCTLIVFGVVGGAIVNLLGIRWTTCLSGLTYALYTSSYIYYNHTSKGAFSMATGPILGIGAGILWSAQGMVMMSYPEEHKKGRYISVFWVVFNLGGVIGGIVPFAINYHVGKGSSAEPLPDASYVAFVALQVAGALCALALSPPSRVIRSDGSHVMLMRYTDVQHECLETLRLFRNPWMLLLLPLSLASNFFYSYQYGPYNGALFTLRTRGLNSMLYWAAQMAAAWAVSYLHDHQAMPRRTRGLLSLAVIAALTNAMWACTLAVQLRYTKGPDAQHPQGDYPGGLIDFSESPRAAGPMLLFCFMGAADAHLQSFAYWLIGTLTNDSQMLARYAGFYKGMQSLGAAIAWQLDAHQVPLVTQLAVNWALFNFAVPFTAWVAWRIKSHRDEVEDQAADDWLMDPDSKHL